MSESKGTTKQALLDKIKELEVKLEESQNREVRTLNKLDAFFQAMTYERNAHRNPSVLDIDNEDEEVRAIEESIHTTFNVFFNHYFRTENDCVVGFREYGIKRALWLANEPVFNPDED